MGRIKFSLQLYLKLIPVLVLTCFAGLLNSPVYAAQLLIPGFYGGTATIPDIQLPVPQVNAVAGKFDISSVDGNMTVDQQQERVVIDWESFDVGKNASVHFDQEQSNWAALNRIYDIKPSQILGKLSADGKVYLINQNGILFGPDSTVNVRSLVASALNIADADFLNSELKYRYGTDESGNDNPQGYLDAEGYVLPDGATVSNHGVITVKYNGAIYFIAPNVENYGELKTESGRIALIGGEDATINASTRLDVDLDDVGSVGSVDNKGSISAASGDVGLYGRNVNHDGVIRAVTALFKNGRVQLRASERISTGTDSQILSTVVESDDKANDSFTFEGGSVVLAGLDVDISDGRDPTADNSARIIDHRGEIVANSGSVVFSATDRVLLNDGSRIDVSGVWTSKSGDANEINAQLNSVELRDEYFQKDGLLKGKTVTFNALLGSAVGDVSGKLSVEEKTALERATTGGVVNIKSAGDIVQTENAEVDFSGGGILFDSGFLSTTKVVVGNRIYDISELPGNVDYDAILTEQDLRNEKYGREKYSGFYYGGAVSVGQYVGPYVQGSDAGKLSFVAPIILAGGLLDGSVLNGSYQDMISNPLYEYDDANAEEADQRIAAVGRSRAVGGTLIVGEEISDNIAAEQKDYVVKEINIVSSSLGIASDLDLSTGDSLPPGQVSQLSDEMINNAGLRTLGLYANHKITTESDTSISIDPGGVVDVHTATIEHRGEISVAGGIINMTTSDNTTTQDLDSTPDDYFSQEQKIYLAEGGVLSVGGQQVDNSLVDYDSEVSETPLYYDGGDIVVKDKSVNGQGVIAKKGSQINVNGGYYVDSSAEITNGNAGSVAVQGHTIALDGEISGLSGNGADGGSIELHADQISLTADAERVTTVPDSFAYEDDLEGAVILDQNLFDDTGFTHIALKSKNDLIVEEGVELVPSTMKLATLTANDTLTLSESADSAVLASTVSSDQIDSSSITLKAGQTLDIPEGGGDVSNEEQVIVSQGATVRVAPDGEISLAGPGVVIDGDLLAPAGEISATADAASGLLVGASATINASGYNRPDVEPETPQLPIEFTPLAGGDIILRASLGDLVLEEGALIDAGAADLVNSSRMTTTGQLKTVLLGAEAGSISLYYLNDLVLDAELDLMSTSSEYSGGYLTIGKLSSIDPMTVSAEDMVGYLNYGIAGLGLESKKDLIFEDSMTADFDGLLTLDAPQISALDDSQVHLTARWVRLQNTTELVTEDSAVTNDGVVDISGDWIDVTGALNFYGIGDLVLDAQKSISLSDAEYNVALQSYLGQLLTEGDLTLSANIVYPTTASEFTLQSGSNLSFLQPDAIERIGIVSAAGTLRLSADSIYLAGHLAAPGGQIYIDAVDRIFLDESSRITTRGDFYVPYGDLDERGFWIIEDKSDTKTAYENYPVVDQAPGSSIYINANEVIVKAGAEIDISGGGGVMSYQYLRGTEGSVSPLDGLYINDDGGYNSYYPNRYVIVPGIDLPGRTLVLEDSSILPAGTYSVLPDEYAYLPGAVVVEATGQDVKTASLRSSYSDRDVVAGNLVEFGNQADAIQEVFAIRAASDVLAEGSFEYAAYTSGAAGNLQIIGETTILDGILTAESLEGYEGGQMTLSASTTAVVKAFQALPDGFSYTDAIPDEFIGSAQILGEGLSGRGWSELSIGTEGDDNITETIMVEQDSVLEADNLNLYAIESIDVEQGALLSASAEDGIARLITSDPAGVITIEENAVVHSGTTIELKAFSLNRQGLLQSDNGSLKLAASAIYLVADDYEGETSEGLYLTESLEGFSGFEKIYLESETSLTFLDDISFSSFELLSIDAGRIVAVDSDLDGDDTVVLVGNEVVLGNSGTTSSDSSGADTATLEIVADQLTFNPGTLLFDGFESIDMSTTGDLVFSGTGGIDATYDGTDEGTLTMSAARVTTTHYRGADTDLFERGNTLIQAGGRQLSFLSQTGAGLSDLQSVNGIFRVEADSIVHEGLIEIKGGLVSLNASELGGIKLGSGAQIVTTAEAVNDANYAGMIELNAETGSIDLDDGSLLDVSAGSGTQAGTIVIDAGNGDVIIDGDLAGSGTEGGSFLLHSGNSQSLDALNSKLSAGGFTGDLAVETHAGNLSLGTGQTLSGRSILLAADGGYITVDGTVEARDGGDIELWARDDLTVNGGVSTQDGDGSVLLASSGGTVFTEEGSRIDLDGGTLHIRAQRTADDVQVNLAGGVSGAEQVFVEGFVQIEDSNISSSDISSWETSTSSFMNSYATAIESRLLADLEFVGDAPSQFAFLPGLEIFSSGNLTLADSWDLSSWRYSDTPGVVTLRAAGDLNLDSDLLDYSDYSASSAFRFSLKEDAERDTWAVNLIAGAEITAANLARVVNGSGDVVIADNVMVYSESAPVSVTSGGNVSLGQSKTDHTQIGGASSFYPSALFTTMDMSFSLGSFDQDLSIDAGGNILFSETGVSAIHTGTGDIDMSVDGDINLESYGAIRTTGSVEEGLGLNQELVSQGGDISINVTGSVLGALNSEHWDEVSIDKHWTARISDGGTTGVTTSGGGDITVRAYGDYSAQTGAFGLLDASGMQLYVGGDIDGRFLVYQGSAELVAGGNFGKNIDDNELQSFEMFDSSFSLVAQGDIAFGSAVNPTLANSTLTQSSALRYRQLSYGESSSVSLVSFDGDVVIAGKSGYDGYGDEILSSLLPSTLNVSAGRDAVLKNNITLAPSANGGLSISAGRSVYGTKDVGESGSSSRRIYMSDRLYVTDSDGDSISVYDDSVHWVAGNENATNSKWSVNQLRETSYDLIHGTDTESVVIEAGGDIYNLKFYVPKKAEITAGGDITNIYLQGQNVGEEGTDISSVVAGGDITLTTSQNATANNEGTGFLIGGDGTLIVQAGGSLDLGSTKGIQSLANDGVYFSNDLPDAGSDLVIVVGSSQSMTTEMSRAFFADLQTAGIAYSTVLASDPAAAAEIIAEARSQVIAPYFAGSDVGEGNLTMTLSSIRTQGSDSSIYLVSTAEIGVGQSSFNSSGDESTGITTDGGGSIYIYAEGDIDVLESRIMTKYGGDISVWSNNGNINAGRGSSTAISAPRITYDEDGNPEIEQAAVGSGIRTLTYDPDGVEGSRSAPELGDVLLVAPAGFIDAGEAGIRGKNVYLGATEVLNSQNISFSSGSVGVPVSSDNVGGLGALAGAGNVSEVSKIADDATSMGQKSFADDVALVDDFIAKWIETRVIGYPDAF